MEALHGRTARLGQPVGTGPAGLAHRVFGDDPQASRADHRHPWRRQRPDLPASRERARPGHVRGGRAAVRALLDAQRHAALRRGEDVEERRQHRDDPRPARRPPRRDAAVRAPLGPLSPGPRLVRTAAGPGASEPRHSLPGAAGGTGFRRNLRGVVRRRGRRLPGLGARTAVRRPQHPARPRRHACHRGRDPRGRGPEDRGGGTGPPARRRMAPGPPDHSRRGALSARRHGGRGLGRGTHRRAGARPHGTRFRTRRRHPRRTRRPRHRTRGWP